MGTTVTLIAAPMAVKKLVDTWTRARQTRLKNRKKTDRRRVARPSAAELAMGEDFWLLFSGGTAVADHL